MTTFDEVKYGDLSIEKWENDILFVIRRLWKEEKYTRDQIMLEIMKASRGSVNPLQIRRLIRLGVDKDDDKTEVKT